MGTEGRLGEPDKEVPPNPQIFEYIVFKGGDVKDLRIEEKPQEAAPSQALPDDPAIMGVSLLLPAIALLSHCDELLRM